MSPVEDVFRVRLHDSPGIEHARGTAIVQRDQHDIRLVFSRYYPDQPIESYAERPIFHPNVKAETGFICLWEQANPRDTVIQALARVQAMAAYRMVNMGAAHVMNRDAGVWYESVAQPGGLVPLTWEELRVYDTTGGHIRWLEPGRRLASSTRSRLH